MRFKALFFGSVGVLAETSDLQRRAFNTALAEAGLDWHWDAETYEALLMMPGGKRRLRVLAAATGRSLEEGAIDEIHRRKTDVAARLILSEQTPLRPGIASMITESRACGMGLALVTTTYRPTIDAIAAAAGTDLPLEAFDAVLTHADAARPKPAPDIYRTALERLGLTPRDAVAIEDTAASVSAAKSAGLAVVATPGAFAGTQDFSHADLVVPALGRADEGLSAEVRDFVIGTSEPQPTIS